MDAYIVNNWSSFQSYKDRNPTWVRLHRALLDDYTFAMLPVDAKALLPLLWLMAAESKDPTIGGLPTTHEIAFRLRWSLEDVERAINPLINSSFILCTESLQNRNDNVEIRATETEERQRQSRDRGETDADTAAGVKTDGVPVGGNREELAGRYAFEGNVIKLTERDFNRWKASFGKLDVPAELEGLDSWLVDHPEKQKSWFNVVAGALAKKQRETPERPKRNIPLAKRELKEEAI